MFMNDTNREMELKVSCSLVEMKITDAHVYLQI